MELDGTTSSVTASPSHLPLKGKAKGKIKGVSDMKKHVRLYNLIFPPYMLIALVPWLALIALVGNFLIDSAVMLVISRVVFGSFNRRFYKYNIWKVWGFGFLGDLCGAAFLFIGQIVASRIILISGNSELMYRLIEGWKLASFLDGTNAYSYVFAAIAIIISAAVIFLLDRFVAFKYADLTKKQKTLSALAIAVVTAPYTFLLPYNLFY